MNILGIMKCIFTHHILDDSQETILYLEFLPGEKWRTECCRCGVGLTVYVEPKHKEVYCMSEDFGE